MVRTLGQGETPRGLIVLARVRRMEDTSGDGIVTSVQVGAPQEWDAKKHLTGINKKPVARIDVADPGEREDGGRSGVAGDWVGDTKHHGGSEQAVYVVDEAELDHWAQQLGKELTPGSFGENVTTRAVTVDDAVIGTRWRIGTALLEVTAPRIPCRTFAWAMDERGWVKRFTERGRSGAYVRVVEGGGLGTGDVVHVEHVPSHGVRVSDAFRAWTGDHSALRRVVEAQVLAPRYEKELSARLR